MHFSRVRAYLCALNILLYARVSDSGGPNSPVNLLSCEAQVGTGGSSCRGGHLTAFRDQLSRLAAFHIGAGHSTSRTPAPCRGSSAARQEQGQQRGSIRSLLMATEPAPCCPRRLQGCSSSNTQASQERRARGCRSLDKRWLFGTKTTVEEGEAR